MIRGVAWLGLRTERFAEMAAFYRDVMGLTPSVELPGQFMLFDLPDGDRIELFGAGSPFNPHFPATPVAEFLVDDVDDARSMMEAKGIEFVHGGRDEAHGIAWAHFRAPDGNLYGLTHRK